MPSVSGVNNHMGSLLTRDAALMGELMGLLRDHGDMYFLDSRTDDQTVAEQVAREMGVPTSRRNVFLDNDPNETYILSQFHALLASAKQTGAAVGIGHPYPETLAVLERELADLRARRQIQVRAVPPADLRSYEHLRPRKRNLAVAILLGAECQGCMTSVSAARVKEARSDALAYCGTCGRILFAKN